MPSVVDSVGSLISSILGVITSIFSGVLGLLQNFFHIIFGIIETALSAIGTSISGLAHTFEGLLKFLFSNILVIGLLVAALFIYSFYQQRSGRPVTAKKTA